jgi:hypothetical protein
MVPRTLLTAFLLAFPAAALAAENPAGEKSTVKSIGVATMLQNGTILVGVPGPDSGLRAQAVLMVEPGDSNYQAIIDHVGGLKPGETKPIPPWPDPPPPPKTEGSPSDLPPGA